MPVRLATTDDLDSIVDMAMRFMGRTRYAAILSLNRDDIKNTIVALLEHGRIWVAEIDGVVRGFIACVMQGAWFSPNTRIALEAAWWMDEEVRGRPEGVRLLLAFERWAKDQQADAICMSDIVLEAGSPAGSILQRLGYEVSERTFMKVIQCLTAASDESTTSLHAASDTSLSAD